ncbi:MAG: hypothetical protein ACI8S6_000967 [Myxococcota bacterium]|jgi:hypothetical protein
MRHIGLIAGLSLLSIGAAGCDNPDCQSTCNKLYQSEECSIASPGSTQTELLTTCLDSCNLALDTPGEVGDYTPGEYTPSSVSVELENDKQAAIWMDCVSEFSCELLDDGYCAPVW